MPRSRVVLASILLGTSVLACAAREPRHVPLGPPVTAAAEARTEPSRTPAPAKPVFEGVGGLFMPEQMPRQAEALRRLGLSVDPALLADPLSALLASIVNFGGCSASFVSAGGLIATNHHCAVMALQYNSTPDANLLKDGFLAASPAGERFTGPTGRVFVTRSLREVTAAIRPKLVAIADDLLRERALERFEKDSVATCEQAGPGTRCELKSFYGGLRFYLVEKLELRDVRLVFAPPSGIGNFGGEVDNWRWPRHTGDFALFRAYVGKDGKPAEHASDNVAYRPPHHLELAEKPPAEGDLVLVAGYPGRTSTLAIAKELENTVSYAYPRRLALFDAYIEAIEAATADDPDAQLKGVSFIRRFNNFRTKHRGELEGIARGKLLEQKQADEAKLRRFIAADPERQQRYGGALDAMLAAIAERDRTREPDTALGAEILLPRLLAAAVMIVRMAEERPKPDGERDPDYQQRKIPDLRDELDALDKRYHPKVDRAILVRALERVLATPAADRTPALHVIAGAKPNAGDFSRIVEALYAGTKLADGKYRRELFDHASLAKLGRSGDSLIRLALALRPILREAEERADRFAGKMLLYEASYAEALLAERGGQVAPDANGTLRVSYGVIRKPPAGGSAFTWLAEVVKKNQGKEPFDAPPALLDAARERRFGAWADGAAHDVPVDFLSNAPITNGNSGSATLDADGKLIGFAFDGTYESVASDWVYLPETRSIHVDLRYLLWVLSEVNKANWLLSEIGVRRNAG